MSLRVQSLYSNLVHRCIVQTTATVTGPARGREKLPEYVERTLIVLLYLLRTVPYGSTANNDNICHKSQVPELDQSIHYRF